MVRATIARLQELNIPLASIRFDAYGGMDGLWQPGAGQGVPTPPTAPVGPGTGVEEPSDAVGPSASGASAVGSWAGSGSRNGWRKDNGWRAEVAGQVQTAETLDEWLVSQAS